MIEKQMFRPPEGNRNRRTVFLSFHYPHGGYGYFRPDHKIINSGRPFLTKKLDCRPDNNLWSVAGWVSEAYGGACNRLWHTPGLPTGLIESFLGGKAYKGRGVPPLILSRDPHRQVLLEFLCGP